MLPTPDEGLASLGAFIRAARIARGINQSEAARDAKVSRKQLALLERGGNVSVKFLLRLARYLDLTALPLDGSVQLVSGQSGGVNVLGLLQSLDALEIVLEHLREFAMAAILPPSERRALKDTPAFRSFVANLLGDSPAGTERLAKAISNLTDDVKGTPAPPRRTDDAETVRRAPRRSRKRRE